MNIVQKFIFVVALFMGAQTMASMISLDSLLQGKTDEYSVRQAVLEAVKKYGKVVLYFDIKSCKYCTTEMAIRALLAQYPDVIFVWVDLTKYPYLKNGRWPKIRFHRNSIFLEETGSLTPVKLKALLNHYYH